MYTERTRGLVSPVHIKGEKLDFNRLSDCLSRIHFQRSDPGFSRVHRSGDVF